MNIKQIRITFYTIVFCLLYFYTFAQKANESMVYSLKKITEPIKVDGFPDDKGWKEIQPTSRFYAVLPMDTGFAKVYTEVKMCFDDKILHLLDINY